MANKGKKFAANVKDATKEIIHRSKAEIEHAKRNQLRDRMTAGEKVKSFMKEDLEKTKADTDRAKRKIRGKT
jgi:hypothetical protein